MIIRISISSIQRALTYTNRWSQNPRGIEVNRNSEVVHLAFFISEAARFEAVYNAVDALFSLRFSGWNWKQFVIFLRKWGKMYGNKPRVGLSMRRVSEYAENQYQNAPINSRPREEWGDVLRIINQLLRLGYSIDSE